MEEAAAVRFQEFGGRGVVEARKRRNGGVDPWLHARPVVGPRHRVEMFGQVRTVGERHISYLLRQWETNLVTPMDDDGDPTSSESKDHQPTSSSRSSLTINRPYQRAKPVWMLSFIALVTFVGSWYMGQWILPFLTAIDRTTLAFALTHCVLYVLVLLTGHCSMYRSYSITDGWNTITRFTVKLGVQDETSILSSKDATTDTPRHRPRHPSNERDPLLLLKHQQILQSSPPLEGAGLRTFIGSDMPASISDSVSTRGTTLNKLMIGVSFCIGVCLFVKFMGFADLVVVVEEASSSSLARWCQFTAFSYACIIFTAMYENRNFDMDKAGYLHHRLPAGSPLLDYEGSIWYDEKHPVNHVYPWTHFAGVVVFLVGSSFGQYQICASDDDDTTPSAAAGCKVSILLSGASLVLGVTFIVMNSLLLEACCRNTWCNKPTTGYWNRARGITCMFIELVALLLMVVSGVAFPSPRFDHE